jgi:hypothetical protein
MAAAILFWGSSLSFSDDLYGYGDAMPSRPRLILNEKRAKKSFIHQIIALHIALLK